MSGKPLAPLQTMSTNMNQQLLTLSDNSLIPAIRGIFREVDMRDAPRRNFRDYRKEKWVGNDIDAAEVELIARLHTRSSCARRTSKGDI